jgi:hypothetical protein
MKEKIVDFENHKNNVFFILLQIGGNILSFLEF